jgi:hypothetical protein
MMVFAPDATRALASSLVPDAKSEIFKTPTGPFQRMVFANFGLVLRNRHSSMIRMFPSTS